MSELAQHVGERIRTQRERLGLTKKELSAVLGVSPSIITHYEAGSRSPSYEILVRASKVLGVTTDHLLGASCDEAVIVGDAEALAFNEFKKLTPRDRQIVLEMIRALSHLPTQP